MRIFFLAGALLAPLACHAVVATTSHTTPGAADAAWGYVGAMGGASAVAIGAHDVLTAGHVAAGDFALNGKTYRMASTEMGPTVGGKATDLRIVHLLDALPGWYALATAVTSKASLTMVGYGGTGVVNADDTGYSLAGGGVRRAGANALTDKATVVGRGPTLRSLLDSAGESVLAGGDSGGGWFVGGQLAGVSSFVYTNDAKKPSYGFAKKAYFGSGAIDLTNKTVHAWVLARRGQSLAPALAQPVPEPGTVVALGLGAVGLLRRGRRNDK